MQTTLKPLFDQLILTNNRPAVEVPPSVKLEDILQAINNGWLEVVMVNRPPLRYRLLAFIRREHIRGDAVRLTAQGRDYYHQHMQTDDSSAWRPDDGRILSLTRLVCPHRSQHLPRKRGKGSFAVSQHFYHS